ncbi:MAG TPA: class I SAM-dependent methyltransferase [Myxococcota bacterium]|nr:class I SAM-dependent methyltransferase [Myxococcota bacterium]
MERIPEPELMDDEAQARAYADADWSEPHDRFVSLLRARLPDLDQSGCALDLGCGAADITIRLAQALPGWTIDGIDGSAPMLRFGRVAVARARLAERITLRLGQIPRTDAPRVCYDLVLSNSLLHHLSEPLVLWEAVQDFARDGGDVFVMDLLRPSSREEAQRLTDRYAAGEPEILRRDFFRSLLASYTPDEVREQLEIAELVDLEVAVASDRHWIAWGSVIRR